MSKQKSVIHKIKIINDTEKNREIHNILMSQIQYISVVCTHVGTTKQKVYQGKFKYISDEYSYIYKVDNNLDRILFTPNFKGISYIWIFLSDNNIEYASPIENKISQLSSPVLMEIVYLLNDMKEKPPVDKIINEKYGILSTDSIFGFNIGWKFIVDFKVDVQSKITRELLLKAPAYKTQMLDNGCVYIQLTQNERDPEKEEDQEYLNAYLKFYNYCKENI